MLKVVESSTSLIDTVGNPTDNFGVKSYKIVYGRPPPSPLHHFGFKDCFWNAKLASPMEGITWVIFTRLLAANTSIIVTSSIYYSLFLHGPFSPLIEQSLWMLPDWFVVGKRHEASSSAIIMTRTSLQATNRVG